jgi:hypothetical protein
MVRGAGVGACLLDAGGSLLDLIQLGDWVLIRVSDLD